MHDLRLLVLGSVAWLAAVGVLALPGRLIVSLLAALTLGLLLVAWSGWRMRSVGLATGCLALVAVLLSVSTAAALQRHALRTSPIAELARQRAVVAVDLRITGDPRTVQGKWGTSVVVRASVTELAGRGRAWRLGAPVLVVAGEEWADLQWGQRVRIRARSGPAEGDLAAILRPITAAEPRAPPAPWWDAASEVRASVRAVVEGRGEHERQLMPAVVDGDESGLDPQLAEDFRDTGLTHLLAVSGTNLTIVVGTLLIAARWLGVRGRWAWLVGGAGVVGFILLARTEPSVLRAAAMGSVALIGMGSNGRSRGVRCLGAAVLGLLFIDPWLALAPGFALSVLATGGILLLAPPWRDALMTWLPRWVAEAVAVPLAAQIACTPVVAAISGEVSLVAVVANLLVAPVVAPATVLGLLGGLVGLLWLPLGAAVAAPGAWCLTWVVVVAQTCAGLPRAAVGWGSGAWPLASLTMLCLTAAVVMSALLRRRLLVLAVCAALTAAMTVTPRTPGWPPEGWIALMCDVGQGDATMVRVAQGRAVLVDAGPDAEALDRCLRRAGIRELELVVLTHFHADHVDGLAGALRGRRVGTVVASPLTEPASGVAAVVDALGHEPATVHAGHVATIGPVTLTVLWPRPRPISPTGGSASGEAGANDASVVLLVETQGVRLLLTGDVEPPAQAGIARLVGDLDVEVLKVPHHGSRHQVLDWLIGLDADVALVGVGADNTYGHPAPQVLDALAAAGAVVGRTDLDGDVAVLLDAGGVRVVRRGPLGAADVAAAG